VSEFVRWKPSKSKAHFLDELYGNLKNVILAKLYKRGVRDYKYKKVSRTKTQWNSRGTCFSHLTLVSDKCKIEAFKNGTHIDIGGVRRWDRKANLHTYHTRWASGRHLKENYAPSWNGRNHPATKFKFIIPFHNFISNLVLRLGTMQRTRRRKTVSATWCCRSPNSLDEVGWRRGRSTNCWGATGSCCGLSCQD
jgi:hypothetical protein